MIHALPPLSDEAATVIVTDVADGLEIKTTADRDQTLALLVRAVVMVSMPGSLPEVVSG